MDLIRLVEEKILSVVNEISKRFTKAKSANETGKSYGEETKKRY